MRTGNPGLLALGLLIGGAAVRSNAAAVAQQTPAARTILPAGPGGPSIDLKRLGDPVQLEQRLRAVLRTPAADLKLSVPNGQAQLGDFSVAAGQSLPGNLLVLQGQLDVSGKISGNVVVLDGDLVLHPGGSVAGDALALGGQIRDRGGVVQGERRSLGNAPATPAPAGTLGAMLGRAAGLLGVCFTLTLLGFGMVTFAKPQLDTISDTVTHSLLRSFLTGLLAQIIVLPTVGLVVTGLVLSIVGVLLVPFVLAAAVLLLILGVLGGFLAVVHAMGETRLRRRMAAGDRVGSANSYRYLLIGLSGFGLVWTAWILVGWVPVAGTLVFLAAFLASWLVATIGFGAALLSRGGTRPGFAGRYLPPEAMTDEYLWATPRFGVDAVKRK